MHSSEGDTVSSQAGGGDDGSAVASAPFVHLPPVCQFGCGRHALAAWSAEDMVVLYSCIAA